MSRNEIEIEIQRERAKDAAAIYDVNQKAFRQRAEAELVNNLRSAGILTLSLVALNSGSPVGHIAFSPVKVTSGKKTIRPIGLGPMSVVPKFQRMGIGTQLVKKGIELIAKEGYDLVFVLGNPKFYGRFGFVPARNYGIRVEYDVPQDAFMVREIEPGTLSKIAGTVKYSPEFDRV